MADRDEFMGRMMSNLDGEKDRQIADLVGALHEIDRITVNISIKTIVRKVLGRVGGSRE